MLSATVSAQNTQDRSQLGRPQTTAPFGSNVESTSITEGHAPPSPNDADLGEQEILKRTEAYQPFTISAGVPFYWTSNAALVNEGEQSDFVVAPAAAITYQPRLTNTLYGLVNVREQLFYYDKQDELNFGDFAVEAGVIYIMPQFYNLILRVEYLYDRLTEKNSFDDFFSNNSIIVNLELPIRLGRAQQIFLGADANISFEGEPDLPRRDDYEVYLGYSAHLTRAFSIDAVGRVVVRDYVLTDRVDVSEILSISANFNVTNFLTASAISTLAANQSNHSVFDYDVANLGGLVSLSFKF